MKERSVKEIIDLYLNYECQDSEGKKENPFLIVAPDGSDDNHLRLYAYGGQAGKIDMSGENKHKRMNKDYEKHSEPRRERPKDLDSQEYLKYAEQVGRIRWLGTNEKRKKKKERPVQVRLAKEFMYNRPKTPDTLLVSDLEYKIPKEFFKESPKVDLILFDGKSFGFVEFKANGQSMGRSNKNSLTEHMKTFDSLLSLTDSQKKDLFLECCRRLKLLLQYELVNKSWEVSINALPKKETDTNLPEELFWCGFLFVGGNEDYIKTEVKYQLADYKDSKWDIRYQYSKEFPEALTMDIDLKTLL